MKRFVAAVCLTLVAGSASFAQTEVYFGEYQFNAPRIGAMQLDGSNARLLFAPPSQYWLPYGLTFNAATQPGPDGTLASFEQRLWRVAFASYQLAPAKNDAGSPLLVPHRIELEHGDLRLRLTVDD